MRKHWKTKWAVQWKKFQCLQKKLVGQQLEVEKNRRKPIKRSPEISSAEWASTTIKDRLILHSICHQKPDMYMWHTFWGYSLGSMLQKPCKSHRILHVAIHIETGNIGTPEDIELPPHTLLYTYCSTSSFIPHKQKFALHPKHKACDRTRANN